MGNLNQELFRPLLKNEISNWLRSVHQNFESRLITSYVAKSYEEKSIAELVLQGMTKEWVKYSDAFVELIKDGKIDASVCLLRSLYEITIQIIYMLNDDTTKKSIYYHVCFYVKNYLMQYRMLEKITDEQTKKDRYNHVLNSIKQQLSFHESKDVKDTFGELCGDYDIVKITNIAEKDWFSVYYSIENKRNRIEKKSFKWMTEELAKYDLPILFELDYSYYALMSRISHGGMALCNHEELAGISRLRPNNDLALAAGNIDFYIKLLLSLYEYYAANNSGFSKITDTELVDIREKLNKLVDFCKEHNIVNI